MRKKLYKNKEEYKRGIERERRAAEEEENRIAQESAERAREAERRRIEEEEAANSAKKLEQIKKLDSLSRQLNEIKKKLDGKLNVKTTYGDYLNSDETFGDLRKVLELYFKVKDPVESMPGANKYQLGGGFNYFTTDNYYQYGTYNLPTYYQKGRN